MIPDLTSEPPPPHRVETGVVVPHTPTRLQRALAATGVAFAQALVGTIRFNLEDRSGHFSRTTSAPAIFCVWHNRLALGLFAYARFRRPLNNTRGLAAMVSASKDGSLLAAILERFNVQPVRGSTSRRGRQALLELTTWAERGYDLAITPDGPRGPRYVVADGVTSLAQLTGMPIVPFSYNLNWKFCARSWDRFQVPLPFARCNLVLGEALQVPREASDEERESLRQQLEQSLRSISKD